MKWRAYNAYLPTLAFIKRLLRRACFIILPYLTRITPKYRAKSLLIIRTDAIGDYVLFRAFLRDVRNAYPYHHITLLGNPSWRDIYEYLDASYCDSAIWVKPMRLHHFISLITTLRSLKRTYYDLLLNPMYSRDMTNALLCAHIYARKKLAPCGNSINLSPQEKAYFDKAFTCLTPCASGILFEFLRNKEFFTHALQAPLHTTYALDMAQKLKIAHDAASTLASFALHKPYCVLFIGASAAYRKWSIGHMKHVGEHLLHMGQNLVICGGKEDINEGAKLAHLLRHSTHNVINLAGETTLIELIHLVYNGNLIISNETSAAHIAACLDTAIIAVSNGNHLGRFIPYPKDIAQAYYPIFHPFIIQNYHHYEALSNAFSYKSTLDINDITPEQVIHCINSIAHKHGLIR